MPDAEPQAAPATDLDLLVEAVRRGGELARSHSGKDPKSWAKHLGSPVSEADIAVDLLMADILREARPHYGWLSEETVDSEDRLSRSRLFVVDPIDGTRAFLAGSDEWTVCASVVEEGRPIAAAIFAPMRDELFLAVLGQGASLNGIPITTRPVESLQSGRLAAPAGFVAKLHGVDGFVEETAPKIASLSLRLALVATGRFDVALASGNSWDWDIAASDLIVAEAGGRLTSFCGENTLYNRPSPRHPPLVACAPRLHDRLVARLCPQAPRKLHDRS